MFAVILYIAITTVAIIAIFKPWIGIVSSYVFIILNPQAIWFWSFQGIRPVFTVLVPTIIGFFLATFRGRIDFSLLKNAKNFWLAVLWVCFISSYFFGPYIHVKSEIRPFDPWWLLSIVNSIFILYFLACLCIDDARKIKALAWVLILSTIYLIYWANDQYFFQGRDGRIGGPNAPGSVSIYRDENAFAMFFVTGLPFLYYLGQTFHNKLYKYGMWLVVPFGWHAIFLTGSRGGLIGLAVTLLVISVRSKNKLVGALIVCASIVAYQWQAGLVMKQRFQTISEYQTEGSASARMEAWAAAIEMIKNHPLTGVGITSFIPAFRYYSSDRPREAHNTFFQISAETGLVGGMAYIIVVFLTIKNGFKNSIHISRFVSGGNSDSNLELYYINEAVLTSFIGIIVCSFFLSLHVYELFYFLCLITNSISYILKRDQVDESDGLR